MDPRYSPHTNLKHKKEEIHMKRKLLSVLLVLAMALTLLPTAVFAEETDTGTDCNDSNCTTETHVASINGKHFTSIQAAIDSTDPTEANGAAAASATTIKVLKDVESTQLVAHVKAGKKIILDTNGKTITSSHGSYTVSIAEQDKPQTAGGATNPAGELTIIGSGKIFNSSSSTAVRNYGKMTIGAQGAASFPTIGRADAQPSYTQNSAIKCEETSTLTIWGGSFVGYARSLQTFGETIIEGGSFSGTIDAWKYADSQHSEGYPSTLTIKGGTFEGAVDSKFTEQSTSEIAGATIDIQGGKFKVKPVVGEYITIPADKVFPDTASNGYFELTDKPADPEKATLAFEISDGQTVFYGKKAEAMGAFDVDDPVIDPATGIATITVTGSANYLTGYDGWQVDTEEEGHYLPLKITATPDSLEKITTYNRTVGAKEGKEIALTDGAEDVAFFLDGKETGTATSELADKTFRVVAGGRDAVDPKIYVIDFSGVTLLPKPANENIEIKPGTDPENPSVSAENSSANVKVEVPEAAGGEEGLGKLQIEVKGAAAADIETAQGTDEAVATAIKGSDSKAVEVTVKQIKEDGSVETENQFTADEALKDNPITVTISGLDTGATYHVFCVKDDKSVVYYGSKELTDGATSIEFTTLHLCHFAAVKETADLAAALENTPVAPGTGLTGSTPLTPGGVYYEVATAAGTIGDKVTIHGEAGKFYIVQIWNGRNTPAAIFCLSSGSGTGVEFYANSGATINIWQADSASAFDGKVPQGLTKVEPQA